MMATYACARCGISLDGPPSLTLSANWWEPTNGFVARTAYYCQKCCPLMLSILVAPTAGAPPSQSSGSSSGDDTSSSSDKGTGQDVAGSTSVKH